MQPGGLWFVDDLAADPSTAVDLSLTPAASETPAWTLPAGRTGTPPVTVFAAAAAGTVRLTAGGNGDVGPYAFRVLDLQTSPELRGGLPTSGTIDNDRRTLAYRIETDAVARVDLGVIADGPAVPRVRVLTDTGRPVPTDADGFDAPAGSTYHVLVDRPGRSANDPPVNVVLRPTITDPADPATALTHDAVVDVDRRVTASIPDDGTVVHAVDLNAGEFVTLDTDGDLPTSASLDILDPGGASIRSVGPFDPGRGDTRLAVPATGRYFLRFTSRSAVDIGYRIIDNAATPLPTDTPTDVVPADADDERLRRGQALYWVFGR